MSRPAPRPGAAVDLRVPGSAANIGPGFDSIGVALGVLDRYRAVVTEEPGLHIDMADAQGAPADERHLVVATMYRAFEILGVERPAGLHLTCRNTIRMGRGMGSSAAAIVAGVALADALWRPEACEGAEGESVPVDLAFVNDLAGALEGHPDNSSASVFGGVTLSYAEDDVDIREGGRDEAQGGPIPRVHTTRLSLHPDIAPVLFVPATQLPTSTARAVLPAMVPHGDAAKNSARAALLVHALTTDPSRLLAATREWLHQEQRRASYSEAMALVDALRADGHAAVISGAGPSVLALVEASRAESVTAPSSWQRALPGIPAVGVTVERATLSSSLGERADAR
ncbi:MAG: homoserine kinase [Mobilicoccus sp.]|nr:homoserine kinase [Mobilicoccus sp.]